MKTYDCIVVGAGITGLSAAHGLLQRGVEVLVLETGKVAGGNIRSERTSDGFILEHGPNTVVGREPELWGHFVQLGIEEKSLKADQNGGRRYIVFNGKPELIPTAPPALLKTPLLSLASKLRVLAEPLLPRSPTDDESVADFFTRRLGKQLAERLIDPFVSGVYAGDPHALSVRSAFPSLWAAERRAGSIVTGMIAGREKQVGVGTGPRPRSVILSFRDGLRTWPMAAARALGDRLWLQTTVTGLKRSGEGWIVSADRDGQPVEVYAAQVVLTVPARIIADLIERLDAGTAQALREIYYPPLAVVHLGFRRESVAHKLDGFGLLCPSGEQRKVLGILWPSSLFEGRAPEGHVLTTSFVGGAQRPDLPTLSDSALLDVVNREHKALLGTRGDPVLGRITRWEHAIPQYNAGHYKRVAAMERLETKYTGLYLAGNFRDGVSVEKCWSQGRGLVERIARRSQSRRAQIAANGKIGAPEVVAGD